jgi:hypothetical protein
VHKFNVKCMCLAACKQRTYGVSVLASRSAALAASTKGNTTNLDNFAPHAYCATHACKLAAQLFQRKRAPLIPTMHQQKMRLLCKQHVISGDIGCAHSSNSRFVEITIINAYRNLQGFSGQLHFLNLTSDKNDHLIFHQFF